MPRACLPGDSVPSSQGVTHSHLRTRCRRLLRQREAQSASYSFGIGQDETCPWPIDCSVSVAHGDADPTWDTFPPSGPSGYTASTGNLQPFHSRLLGAGSLWLRFARLVPCELFSDGPGTGVLLEPVFVDGGELPPRAQRCRISRCQAAALAGTLASGAPIVGDDMACPGLDMWPFPCWVGS